MSVAQRGGEVALLTGPVTWKQVTFILNLPEYVDYVIHSYSSDIERSKKVVDGTVYCRLRSVVQALFLTPCFRVIFTLELSFLRFFLRTGTCDSHPRRAGMMPWGRPQCWLMGDEQFLGSERSREQSGA